LKGWKPVKAYSIDMRERVLQAFEKGYARTEIIKLFGVSRATIKRYLKQRRETGDLTVRPIPGGLPRNPHLCGLGS
jgi:transposase